MLLSIPTLILVTVFLLGLMGTLTLHTWARGKRERPLGYLGAMLLLASVGVALISLRERGYDLVPLVLGNIVLLLSAALGWTAMRTLAGRAPYLPGIAMGVVVWLLFCFTPVFYDSLSLRITVYSTLAAAYSGLGIVELWRSRNRLDMAYMPALLILGMHTIFYLVRLIVDEGLSLENALSGSGDGARFFAVMLFESMLYATGIAYITLAMVKEQAEKKYKTAANTDELTGIGNRRAFITQGEQILAEAKRTHTPITLLLFDLDHFKRLNDSLGHQAGDQALIAFSQLATRNLRHGDVFGRIGGEEFACLLPGAGEQIATLVAQNIRQRFHSAALPTPGSLSVSIGVVTSEAAGYELSRLLALADDALYAAKAAGRNRVHVFEHSAANEPAIEG
ncbi:MULTISPECIES: GGDEF domain-containing protein [Pseudomonas]|uniref:diguanylate cyclase n=1 Tax=Pseudomonas guariconensis TaxID=1288410 RepID=A0AAX0W041_9PSED|nr:GGDEF domain-containing protein [Pseudomonas guariconensis]MBH3358673.1 GGDEF domain-containing protein [Pseudomonas guariconensis]MCO7623172.1 GGDEF domain-containing protein [Pseudomonas guariconensis]MDM9594452.1 GGDEF domain-containing protein [Pseudomonas guariconensis]MDM9607282.1 GGDEF domain-containing protein [Pseudomonas guariconensis]MDM9612238.1 GGDEF domain-containing protein [Pseudomonas guariconensis]